MVGVAHAVAVAKCSKQKPRRGEDRVIGGGVRVCQQRELFNNQVGWGQRSKAKAKSTEEMLARDNATPEQNRQRSKPREVRGRKKMWQRALYAYVRCYSKAR
jgi:hypothetical protein